MNKENCALKLVDEIILYYDARSKKHKITLKYNWDRAYVNEFPVAVEDPDVGKLSTTAQEAINLMRGHNFGSKAED